MKRIVTFISILAFVAIIGLVLIWFSSNTFQKKVGGSITVDVPRGEKVISASMNSEGSVFYLTEPMDSGYIPKQKVLREKSNMGIVELTVKFREHGRKIR